MSEFLIICNTPAAGDSVTIDGSQWFFLEDPLRVWRGPIGNENTVAMKEDSPEQLADALTTGLLVDGKSASRAGRVVTIAADTAQALGSSFTVQAPQPAATPTGFKAQLITDLDVFLNTSEFAETHLVDGSELVCILDLPEQDYSGADGAFVSNVPTLIAKTAQLAGLLKGAPRVGKLLIIDNRSYKVTSVAETCGMTTVEMESA